MNYLAHGNLGKYLGGHDQNPGILYPLGFYLKKAEGDTHFLYSLWMLSLTFPVLISAAAVFLSPQSAPVPANAGAACSCDCRDGKGCCSAVQHSPRRMIPSMCCTGRSLGGDMGPSLLSPRKSSP